MNGHLKFTPIALAISVAKGIQSVINAFFPNCGIIKALQSIRELKEFVLAAANAFIADIIGFWNCITGGGDEDYFCLYLGTKEISEKVEECEAD